MSTSTVGLGWIETLLILLGGSGLLGMPPGERDPAFIRSAPQQSLVYIEWAARGSGKPGAPGIDGLAADPEIQALCTAIETMLRSAATAGDEEPEPVRRDQDLLELSKLLTAHPGCLYAAADPPQESGGLLKVPQLGEVLSRFHVCLIVDSGADIAAILNAINRALAVEIPPQPRMFELPGPLGQKWRVHQDGNRLLVGLGAGTIERSLQGLRGEHPGLDSNPRFQAGWKHVACERVGSIRWLDVQGMAEVVFQSLGPAGLLSQAVFRGAGADAMDCVTSATGVVGGTVIERTFIATSGNTGGNLVLAKNPALKLDQLSHIPADSDMVLAVSLDLAQLFSGVRGLVVTSNPLSIKVFDEATRVLESELGLSLRGEVFPAFGNAWTAFSSPSEGGLPASSLVVALETRDSDKAAVVFDRLMQLLEQSLAVEADSEYVVAAELKRQEFLGHTICYVRRSGQTFGFSATLIPSFCQTRNHLLFAVHPQALKAHLRHLEGARPGFDSVARTRLSRAGEELLMAGYLDGVQVTRTLAGLVPYLGQSLMDVALGNGKEFDSFAIPSAAALVPYAGDITLSVARQKGGLLMESRNPQYGIALLALLWGAHTVFHPGYDSFLEVQAAPAGDAQNAGLGAPEGQVIPAAAEKPAKPAAAKPDEKPVELARPPARLELKALVPPDIRPLIPDEVFRKLSEPPSPEVLKQREERRKLNEQRRLERAKRRPFPPRPQ